MPYRGVVDEPFIKEVLERATEARFFLLVRLTPEPYSIALLCDTASSYNELREWLEDNVGERVALGEEPHFTTETQETAITVTKDGIIGVY